MKKLHNKKIKLTMPKIAIISFLFFLVLFLNYPKLDLDFSSVFFQEGQFLLSNGATIKWLDRLVEFGSVTVWMTSLLYFAIKEKKSSGKVRRELKYIGLVGLVGAIGLVHLVKRIFMRCRPFHMELFGGPSSFLGPWTVNSGPFPTAHACLSFVSGHAALGFLIFSLAFLYDKSDKKHRRYLILGGAVGTVFGLMRIMQGQHFLSDVIFSGYLVFFSAFLLDSLVKPSKKR